MSGQKSTSYKLSCSCRHPILLIQIIKLLMQDYKREAFMKAYMQCSNAIQKMEKELRTACQAPAAKFDDILKVISYSFLSLKGLLHWFHAECLRNWRF